MSLFFSVHFNSQLYFPLKRLELRNFYGTHLELTAASRAITRRRRGGGVGFLIIKRYRYVPHYKVWCLWCLVPKTVKSFIGIEESPIVFFILFIPTLISAQFRYPDGYIFSASRAPIQSRILPPLAVRSRILDLKWGKSRIPEILVGTLDFSTYSLSAAKAWI